MVQPVRMLPRLTSTAGALPTMATDGVLVPNVVALLVPWKELTIRPRIAFRVLHVNHVKERRQMRAVMEPPDGAVTHVALRVLVLGT